MNHHCGERKVGQPYFGITQLFSSVQISFRVGDHEIRKELIWCKEEKKKKNPSKSGVLPGKQNEKIQGKEMYGIGHSGTEMMDHCPKVENEGKKGG